MKLQVVVCGAALAFSMLACQQENIPEQGTMSENTEIRLRAAISDNRISRTITDVDRGTVTFDPDDEIGFFMPNAEEPVKFSNDETSGWEPAAPVAWPNLTEKFTFHAFYPYKATATRSSIPMPNLDEQTGALEEIGAYDFLTATKTCGFSDASGEVSFTGTDAFDHVYSLLLLTLSADSNVETLLKSVSLTGEGCFTHSTYSFADGTGKMIKEEEAEGGDTWTLDAEGEAIPGEEGIQLALLLNPSETEVSLQLTIGYTREGIGFTASTEAIRHTFVGGNSYKYTIRINDGQLIIEGMEVSGWITGEVEGGGTIVVDGTPQGE